MAAASKAVKAVNSSLLVSHAPEAPFFGPVGGSLWPGPTGGMTGYQSRCSFDTFCLSGVYAQAPNAIDWFNCQFYNQGFPTQLIIAITLCSFRQNLLYHLRWPLQHIMFDLPGASR